ncbi:GNAT family N-acetyltransferase [Pseudoteredinibacter isoporae]|uniref:Ribosomal protein S18 acetylase RimI-like enzyme n=1 Tax=Pseudoteredinibacter isoporae TaxID=570281 RepID=A0A7X0MUL0_9GAMM|nr:GNAT family N-acetyltransferase [Pseudoteredinibacter isoporae]MBB6520398.1 ribosomal protein S18 acetylase RimI-like enzyme [Pseudoteredinibacter isoporae]NHO85966.1 GNAT family N-acetyltransferase [Pseudoteredinibacter isoporae]NIB25582.1 GNAT family N-acetyltransferase [Pseudoteredinibacter isoporae]
MPNRKVHECHLDELNEAHWSLMLMADPDREVISNYLPDCRIFSVNTNGSPIALALLLGAESAYGKKLALSEGEAELINIAVILEQQGKGLAKQLIQHCIEVGRQDGLRSLWIGTGNSSLSQLALYQKMGFRLHHIVPDYFSEYPETIIENGIECLDMLRLQLRFECEVSDVRTEN